MTTLTESAQQGAAGVSLGEPGRMQKALAACYFYSPAPRLLRPLRDRYRLTVSRNTRCPRVWIEKRTGATARILYYHRVNDDNNPFFPAITTALFDAQMRYLSRHYRVVSLAELVRSLKDESPQPVVAITFDDGYKDNYLNAFPILERYGLPATIFLTTGNLDSREPMWFERVAAAVQQCPGDFVDLEIDFGRRHSLASSADRLKCVCCVFELLRHMTETDRRLALPRLLDHLAANDRGQSHDKMLTWDQVRLMSKCGVDFGGHTVTHPFLSRMPDEQVQWEVSECKKRIEEEVQRPVAYFAYPNGREKDFGAWNKKVVQQAGYQAAVTTIWGPNYSSTDPMELRRGGPWERGLPLFACKLDWYQWVDG